MLTFLLRQVARVLGVILDRLLGPPPPQAPAPLPPAVSHPVLPAHGSRMRWMRLPLVTLPALALVGAVFCITFGAPALFAAQTRPVPQQPISFDHQVHVQQLGLDCAYCHRTANNQPIAGMPDVQVCMNCHVAVGPTQNSQIKTLQDDWVKQEAVNWVRVWRMPDYVRFQHDVHVQAGIACKDCHGDVGSMHQLAQGQSMKMQDCVACHQRMNAPTTCDTCHY